MQLFKLIFWFVEVIMTPKCHAKLAGEGVEYMWACSKGAYRNLALKDKKGKVCRHKSFQSSAFESLQDEHDSTFSLTMLLTAVKSAQKFNETAPSMVLLDWRS